MTTKEERKTFKIFLGRGNGVANKAGNQLYRQTIRDTKPVYQEAKTHKEKERIALKLIEDLEQMGATFHFQVNKRWMKAPNGVVLKTVKQALREKHQSKQDGKVNHVNTFVEDDDCIEGHQQDVDEQPGLPRNKNEPTCEDKKIHQSPDNIEQPTKDRQKFFVNSAQLAVSLPPPDDNKVLPSDEDVSCNHDHDQKRSGDVFTPTSALLLLNDQDHISSCSINRIWQHGLVTNIAGGGQNNNKKRKLLLVVDEDGNDEERILEEQQDHNNCMSKKNLLPHNSAPSALKKSTNNDMFEPIKLGGEELVGAGVGGGRQGEDSSSSIELMKMALFSNHHDHIAGEERRRRRLGPTTSSYNHHINNNYEDNKNYYDSSNHDDNKMKNDHVTTAVHNLDSLGLLDFTKNTNVNDSYFLHEESNQRRMISLPKTNTRGMLLHPPLTTYIDNNDVYPHSICYHHNHHDNHAYYDSTVFGPPLLPQQHNKEDKQGTTSTRSDKKQAERDAAR